MDYPKYAQVGDTLYPINTDFKVAIRCNEVAQNESICDTERALAIIYLLFGEKGLRSNDKQILLEKAQKYLSCGKELEDSREEPDMDYVEDYPYIKTSFRSDYGINLDKDNLHWWEFNELMNGLSNSEFGNCCILNRIRNLRNYDLKNITDSKEKRRIKEAQEMFALKKNKEVELTEEQQRSLEQFYRLTKS